MEHLFPRTSGRLVIKRGAFNSGRCYVRDLASKTSGFSNEDAADLLRLCDGLNSIEEIRARLAKMYMGRQEDLVGRIDKTIRYFGRIGIVKTSRKQAHMPIRYIKNGMRWSLDVVYLVVTSACNLSCRHCYAGASNEPGREMSTGEILSLIDRIADLGALEIVITGGEPLLRKDIFRIMRRIRMRCMDFILFTNGTLLDEAAVRKIGGLAPRMVAVSLESPGPRIHDSIRGKGSFSRAVRGIGMLQDSGVPVRINTTLFRGLNDGERQLESMLGYLKRRGIRHVALGGLITAGRGKELRNLQPRPEAAGRVAKAFKRFNAGGKSPAQDLAYHDSFTSRSDARFDRHSMCGVGTFACAIRPDGTLSLCPVLSSDREESALEKDLHGLWLNSGAFRPFREKTVDDIAVCRDCERRHACLGGCKANANMYNGRFDSPDWWACGIFRGPDPGEPSRKTGHGHMRSLTGPDEIIQS